MTPRDARRKLGSRVNRRSGTKTQTIPGCKPDGKGAAPKYTHPRRQKPRPAVLVRRLRAAASR